MSEQELPSIFSSAVSILGFGFVGLSFLMAILGYRALIGVINAPNPNDNVVRLARLFMFISLALLICAGPLHFGLLYAQQKFTKLPVSVTISLANTTWEADSFGDVGIMKGGVFKSLSATALSESFTDGGEINIQLDKVILSFKTLETKLRAQIVAAVSQNTGATPNSPINAPPPVADAAFIATTGG